jgi:hypothetical protein
MFVSWYLVYAWIILLVWTLFEVYMTVYKTRYMKGFEDGTINRMENYK